MRKSSLEKLRDSKKSTQTQMHLGSYEELLKLLCDGSRKPEERRLNPTQLEFNASTDPISLYMGVVGCAKTSTICSVAWSRALFQPGSKIIVSRQDYNDLMGTTYVRMTEMLNLLPKGTQIGRDKTPPEKWTIQPVPMLQEDGTIDDRPSEITFMALKEDLGSVEANCWVIDEANEVEEKRIHEIQMRLRAPGGNYVTALCCNPPDKHHWLYTACTGKDFQDRYVKPPWMKLFTPKPNENQRNLPKDYYTKHAANMPPDMVQRLIEGNWGSDLNGVPVYKEFKYAIHVHEGLKWDGHGQMYRFWDFGYNRPCVIWAYCDWEGRLIILGSELGEKLEAKPWAQKVKAWSKERFPGVTEWLDFGDPAIVQKKDTGSTLHDFHQEGITMHYRPSTIEAGAKLIRSRLNLLISGEPALQIEKNANDILIRALRGGYRMDKAGLKPFKDGYYDHLMDALRYGLINLFQGGDDTKPATHYGALPASIEYQREHDV